MNQHLLFFDAECAVCQRAVKHIADLDREKQILFAPLEGETARAILTGPNARYKRMNSLIFLENYQSTEREFWIRSRAILRIYWILGGNYALLGSLSFLPCWIGDLLYRVFAIHRHQFKLKPMRDFAPKDRFLS